MSKKLILAMMLAVVMIFVAACGDNDNGGAADPTPTPEQAQDTPDPTPDPAPAPGDETDNDEDIGVALEGPDLDWDNPIPFLDYHFPAADLGGITIRVGLGFGNPYHENEVEAARDQAARERIESRFNVVLDYSNRDVGAHAGGWGEVPEWISAGVAAGDPPIHIMHDNAGYWLQQLAQSGDVVNMDSFVRANFPLAWFNYVTTFNGQSFGFMRGAPYQWRTMVYNRPMIRASGIQYTPQEMFIQGRWSLDDAYDYLVELQSLLGPDIVPIAMHQNWWLRYGSYANGSWIVDPNTNFPGFLREETLEPLRWLTRLVQDGLWVQPGFMEYPDSPFETGHWSFGAAFIGDLGRRFMDGEIAISNRAPWGFEELSTYFEFGIIPPPWGSNVQFPASGDWRDLKTHSNYRSLFNDANASFMIVGTPAALTPEVLAAMSFTFDLEAAERLVIARAQMEAGITNPILELGSSAHLFTDLDVEIWQWYASNPVWEGMDSVGLWLNEVQGALLNSAGGMFDWRTGFEAVYPRLIWHLMDFGTLLPENVPAEWLTLAQEFGAQQAEEAEDEE